jgi:predicted transcriptional regulator
MTLRLEPSMESELEDLAYGRNVSKAGFIRRCIRQAIADAYERGTQHTQIQTRGGAL